MYTVHVYEGNLAKKTQGLGTWHRESQFHWRRLQGRSGGKRRLGLDMFGRGHFFISRG